MSQSTSLSFYATPPHDCNYLPGRESITVFADPRAQMDNQMYGTLLAYGYRRSGSHVYAPYCIECTSCKSMRVPVNRFKPTRSQRRNLKLNSDLTFHIHAAEFNQEHFELYLKYISTRHQGGGMDDPDPAKYKEFLIADWCNTDFVEFRDRGRLLAVSIIDKLYTGLSAVYTFFDHEESQRGLGTYAWLWQV
ncbi:MAG: arginyltransferase, partial [Gammaproteobacteria bacterium]|nr:arginyltransferase [Gammaproteobacteria bacterium]